MTVFSTPGPVTVVLDAATSLANVRLTASDRSDTVVEVLPTNATKSIDVTHAEDTVVTLAGDEVRIATPHVSLISPRTRSVDIIIHVPTGSSVRGKAGSGDFVTEGELATCDYTTQGGTISVDQVGPAALEAAGGDVRIRKAVRGTISAATMSGTIDVGVSHDAAVKLSTNIMSGAVTNNLNFEHDGRAVSDQVDLDIRVMSGGINLHRAA